MIAILGLQVVVGYTGQLALGQSFFFGTGAYIAAWLVADQNWPWLATLIVVVPACFILGVLFGIPALRIKGLYLALVTLGPCRGVPLASCSSTRSTSTPAVPRARPSIPLSSRPSWLPLDGIADVPPEHPVLRPVLR